MEFEPGDLVEIKNKDGVYRGILMPKHIFSGDDIVIIKLDNGYNIGIRKDDTFSMKLISKGETKTVTKKVKKQKKGIKVSVIGTGGTIASYIDYRTGAVKPAVSQEELLLAIPEIDEQYDIRSRNLFSIFSENMDVEHWKIIAREVEKEFKDARGIIISHGTDTMSYTAASLAFMLQNLPGPVVLVGSQRSSDRPSSDAYLNLLASLKLMNTDLGEVTVAMHATTSDTTVYAHRGVRVRKMHTSRRDAFRSINTRPIAEINSTVKFISEYRKASGPIVSKTNMDERAVLLYYYPNMDRDILYDIGSRIHGMILAGTGLGHVSQSIIPVIRDLVRDGVFIGITSQCLYGSVNLNVYSTGREMISAGVVPLGDMLPEVAYVKLMWAMGNFSDVRDIMTKNLVGEMNERRVGLEYV